MMNEKLQIDFADQRRYSLDVTGVVESLTVSSFSSMGYGVNGIDRWQIDVTSKDELSHIEFHQHPAKLFIADSTTQLVLHRYLSATETLSQQHNSYQYRLTLTSPLAHLVQSKHYRSFVQQNLSDIVQHVLRPLSSAITVKLITKQQTKNIPYRVQSGESDFDFLHNLFADYAINFILMPGEDKPELIIFDTVSELGSKQITLNYVPLSGTERLTDTVWQIDQQTKLFANKTYTEYLAQTDAITLVPGSLLTVQNHPNQDYNITYRVIESNFKGQQLSDPQLASKKDKGQLPFINKLRLIPASENILPLVKKSNSTLSTTTATIESNNKNAYLDQQGYYHVHLPLDQNQHQHTQASQGVPQVHAYGGQRTGWHFPLVDQATVALGYLHDDIHQPAIVGALPSINADSVVSQNNVTQHLFRSNTGHEMCYDDAVDNNQIAFTSSQQKNRFVMQARSDDGQINIHSVGSVSQQAHKNIFHNIKKDHTTIAQDQTIQANNKHSLLTQHGSISLQSGNNIDINAKNVLHLASDQSTQFDLTKDSNSTAKQNLTVISQQGDVNLRSKQTSQLISQKALIVQNSSPGQALNVQAGQAILQCTNNNNIVTANTVTMSAPTINIHGKLSGKNIASSNSQQQKNSFSSVLEKLGSDLLDLYVDETVIVEKHS